MSTSAKLRVLIAEDEVLVSMFLADLVEDAGFEVVGVARTAPDAVALAQQHRPDIALMDANLKGGASGIAAAEAMARDQDIAIIFISGDSGLADDPAVAALKPVAVVEKPCMPDDLTAVLQRAARLRNAD
ncbi:response regulator [Paracoccus chinensis]|uniref:Response regulator receiver domain-containing protein n=1 Tax=Paracoccus chinensis TaxID=525640 RepID=A0A1G9DDK3_9RHOB|nr:response regulator [Paracoccus chinensis]SDK61884.1 Response regulator receiver domain-containing protein [Paracoccus chinensis]